MIEIEHESDWTRNRDDLEVGVRAAVDAISEIVKRAPPLAVRRDGVQGQIDDYGVLTLDLPLGSGDAFWIHLGDGWERLLWIAASDRNEEWEWDEETSPAFLEAVINGRARREITSVAGERRSIVWRWTDAAGREHLQPDSHVGRPRGLLQRLRGRSADVQQRIERIDPLPR